MRRLWWIATVTALIAALALPGAASAGKGPKLPAKVAGFVASAVGVAIREQDPNTIALQVLPCERRGRRKFTCDGVRTVNREPEDQVCRWVTTVFANKKGKVFFKVSPETCGPVPPPFASGR